MSKIPRGIRNNNPGNIDYNSANPWQGQIGIEIGVAYPRFARFSAMKYGTRAIAKLLLTYRKKYRIDTVSGIANRWAPESENDTGAYMRFLAGFVGVSLHDKLDLDDAHVMSKLVKAIIVMENGAKAREHVSDDDIDKGVLLALGGQ